MERLLIFFICVSILTGVCCMPPKPEENLERALKMHQSDIPIPLEYRYLADKSRIEQFSSFRLCELLYKSPPDATHGPRALTAFYEKFMPTYNWKKVEWKKRKYSMMFQKNSKPTEFCRIDIYRRKSITTLYILVGNKTLVSAD